jgi:predicted Rdx family selenoprotein
VQLKRSSGGVFYVYKNGKMLFSRHETGRYPDTKDIEAVIAAG